MNDRIIELRKKAWDLVQIDLQTNDRDEAVDNREHLKMVFDKFAELIVRECTDLMYNAMQNTEQPYDLAYHAMLTQLIAEIQEQFGIAESKRQKFGQAIKEAFKNGVDLSGQETP